MCNNGPIRSPGYDQFNDTITAPEFVPKSVPGSLEFATDQADEPSVVDLPALTSLDSNPGHKQQAHLWQIGWTAYQHNQYLMAIIRPFLSRTTWAEAIRVARCGGRALPAKVRTACILWLDIAGFTGLTDSHPLEQVLSDLNAYLDTMTQIVYGYAGDVNKYLGDGFLGIFNIADDAVRAGCAIQQAATDFNRRQMAQGGMVFHTRIGVASGQVGIVSLGSSERQDRTVIGAPVNMAKRLQENAPPGRVWLSQATFDQLSDPSGCRYVGPVKVKGQQELVVVYER